MSDVFQLLGPLRNKLRCTLRHLRQQLRHSLRASEIRLRRTVRTDFLLRVPPRWNNSNWPVDHLTAADHMELVCDGYDNGGSVYALLGAGEFTGRRGERPRGRAAKCSQQFPPSDADSHVPLPREGANGTIPRHQRAVFTLKEGWTAALAAQQKDERLSPLSPLAMVQ